MKKRTKEFSIKLYNDVRDFESKADRKYRIKELSSIFGVSRQTISRIRSGRNIVLYKYGTRNYRLIDPYLYLKNQVFNLYNNKCNLCGFLDKRALQIDHINGGGGKERKKGYNGYTLYRDVINNPNKYQLLCANCNWIKRHTNNEVKKATKKSIK